MIPPPPRSTLFPYTTLFRSQIRGKQRVIDTITKAFEAAAVPLKEASAADLNRSEEHTSELQSRPHLVCRLLLEKKKILPRAPIAPSTPPPPDDRPPALIARL